MSSTDGRRPDDAERTDARQADAERDARLREFFEARIVPAAERLRERGVSFFPLGPDPARQSYYARRAEATTRIAEFEAESAAAELRALWGEHPELLSLIDPLLELAAELRQRDQDRGAEVSPFIYAMF
jgi:hypothetical protein